MKKSSQKKAVSKRASVVRKTYSACSVELYMETPREHKYFISCRCDGYECPQQMKKCRYYEAVKPGVVEDCIKRVKRDCMHKLAQIGALREAISIASDNIERLMK